jgi:hypothetical protein
MAVESGVRFSVYFHEDQIKWLDAEANKMNVSRSKFIELKVLPKELQKLQSKRGRPKKN